MNLLLHDGGHEEIKLWKIPEYRRHTRARVNNVRQHSYRHLPQGGAKIFPRKNVIKAA